jgi:hypothetical protein
VAKNRINNNFKPVVSFTMDQKFLFSKLLFVAYFDQNQIIAAIIESLHYIKSYKKNIWQA